MSERASERPSGRGAHSAALAWENKSQIPGKAGRVRGGKEKKRKKIEEERRAGLRSCASAEAKQQAAYKFGDIRSRAFVMPAPSRSAREQVATARAAATHPTPASLSRVLSRRRRPQSSRSDFATAPSTLLLSGGGRSRGYSCWWRPHRRRRHCESARGKSTETIRRDKSAAKTNKQIDASSGSMHNCTMPQATRLWGPLAALIVDDKSDYRAEMEEEKEKVGSRLAQLSPLSARRAGPNSAARREFARLAFIATIAMIALAKLAPGE